MAAVPNEPQILSLQRARAEGHHGERARAEVRTGGGDERPHAIVIGSGFGGLAAAVRLGARGYRVTVLEALDTPGGRARVLEQDGFTFDAGPTIITAPFLFEELWSLAGRRLADDVELRALDPFYRIHFADGTVFEYSGDPERMRAEVARIAPGDVAGYERFMRLAETIYRIGFEELGHVPFGRFTDMLRIAPHALRLKSHLTVWQVVARHVRDERLRTVLSFHPLLIGGNPFRTTSIYALIACLERRHGVHFAMGGMGALVRGLVRLIEGQGGTLRLNARVGQILSSQGAVRGVRLESGEQLMANVVVSNADASSTYRQLLPQAHVRRRWTDRRLARSHWSMSLFLWYFGTRRRYEDVGHHTLILGPRYRGLLTDIFDRKHLAEDFSLYLHRPTATDPALAPPGCDAFYVLSPVPNLDSGTDWHTAAEAYRKSIEAHLERTILPGLAREVATSRVFTPLDFESQLAAWRGAAFAMEPRLTQSAYFRPHNASEELAGLYLVGAGTHPGAGLPGVLSSARVLDGLVADARQRVK